MINRMVFDFYVIIIMTKLPFRAASPVMAPQNRDGTWIRPYWRFGFRKTWLYELFHFLRIFPAVLDGHGFHFGGSYCARLFRAARLLAKDDGIGPHGLGLGGQLGQPARSGDWGRRGGTLQHRKVW